MSFALAAAACARAPAAVTPSRPVDPLQQLKDDITAATTAPGVRRAAWGILVQSLDRGERLFALNPGTLLVPASTVKLVSLASAVDAVGWGHQFETSFWTTGPIVNGVIQGDLIVTGSGDPSIGGRGGTELTEWIQALRKIPVRRIEGRIVGDDNSIEEPRPQLAWAWDDLGYATGAIFGALNYAENRMDVTVVPGATAGAQPMLTVEPHAAARPLYNRAITQEPGSMPLLWPEQRPGEPFLTIAGFVPAGAPPARMTVSVGNPTLWFASVLRHQLIAAGIEVAGGAYDVDDVPPLIDRRRGADIYGHWSPPLSRLAGPMLKESINLYGEAVLRLNAAPGVLPTNDAALEGLRARLRSWGIADEAWQIVDGSGLSRRNAVAPEVLVAVLQRMYDASGTSPWMEALPVAGRDGTLESRMRGTAAEGNVRAKTGTMTNVRTLAGYARTRDGETLAFAIMADAFEGPGAAAVDAIDRIAVRLATFSRDPRSTTATATGHGDTEARMQRDRRQMLPLSAPGDRPYEHHGPEIAASGSHRTMSRAAGASRQPKARPSWSARLGPASQPFQPRRRHLTDKAIDENGREIGLFLDVAADLGVWLRRVRSLRLDAAALLFDGLRDRGAPVRRQALSAAIRFVAMRVVEGLVQQRVSQREDLFPGAVAEPLDLQVTSIGQGEVQQKRPHLCERAAVGVPNLIELDDRVVLVSRPHH